MANATKEDGKRINFKVEVYINGQMADNMMENSVSTRRMEGVATHGQMEIVMMDNGPTVFNTELESSHQKEKPSLVDGRKEKELSGSKISSSS